MKPIMELEKVRFSYTPGCGCDLLKDLTFAVEPGVFLGIVGPNGSGKTTLLRLLIGLLRPQEGLVCIDGRPVDSYTASALAVKVAVVSQDPVVPMGFSVLETVLMARVARLGQRVFASQRDLDVVNQCLGLTDTSHLASRPLSCLSGGERQRVFIARALAQETDIILLDEPTTFLDLRHQVEAYDLLKQVQIERNKTVMAISHDINLAARYCDQVLVLVGSTTGGGDGFLFGRPQAVLTLERIEQIFGVQGAIGLVGGQQVFVPRGKYPSSG
jgi:iron complex transport system ATP-binding protein